MNADAEKYENARKQARRTVRRLKGFYIHLGVYVLINAMLVLINLTMSPNVLWFYWPLGGWGIGLAAHALSVYVFGSMFGSDWEERKINELINQA